jgi:hypothetical protein
VIQGEVSTTPGRFVRLALIFCATVFGLLLLSFAFGSSSASADDGGPDDGGLLPAAAEIVGDAVETVAPVAQAAAAIPVAAAPVSATLETASSTITAVVDHTPATPATAIVQPVSTVVDGTLLKVLGDTAIGDALGTAPIGSLLLPVAEVVDTVVKQLGEAVPPALGVVPGFVTTVASASIDAAAASGISATAAAISGFAEGNWRIDAAPLGTGQPGASSASLTITVLPAAALGAAFFVLLFSRRLGLVNSALPVSPVFETDTSPD